MLSGAWEPCPEPPLTWVPGIDRVAPITTHGAVVFLAGNRAYKMKRAVRYPYMDFATLAPRAADWGREIARSRRGAPELYPGVEAVMRGQLACDLGRIAWSRLEVSGELPATVAAAERMLAESAAQATSA